MAITYSIILATLLRKEEHRQVIQECLDSVKAHTDWDKTELIISDDGSPLDTTFLREAAHTYVRRDHAQGCAVGWNQGLKLAKGKYYIILSDDVVVVPGWIECMQKGLDSVPHSIVSAPSVQHMPNQGGEPKAMRRWFPASCFMLKKEAIKKVGYFDEQFAPFNYEDVDYWTRVCKAGYEMARCFDVEVKHREGDVIHNIENNGDVDSANRDRYFAKWGFNPIPILYDGSIGFPWE